MQYQLRLPPGNNRATSKHLTCTGNWCTHQPHKQQRPVICLACMVVFPGWRVITFQGSNAGLIPHPHLVLTSETPDSLAVVRLPPAPCMLLLLLVLLPPITSSRAAVTTPPPSTPIAAVNGCAGGCPVTAMLLAALPAPTALLLLAARRCHNHHHQQLLLLAASGCATPTSHRSQS